MLQKISVRNYALIHDVELDLDSGLNIMTGETGAGKSILLGALGLVLGQRADSKVLPPDAQKCVIEAWFRISGLDLEEYFTGKDLDWNAETVLRREVTREGRSRAFVNDSPVGLDVLKELGEMLIDVHSQHDTLRLRSSAYPFSLLDTYAGIVQEVREFGQMLSGFNELNKTIETLKAQALDSQKKQEYLEFQLRELQTLDPGPDELEELEAEQEKLDHAEAIREAMGKTLQVLDAEDTSAWSLIQMARQALEGQSAHFKELEPLLVRLESAAIEVREVHRDVEHMLDQVQVDEARRQQVGDRLNLYYKLFKKHGVEATADLLRLKTDWEEELDGVAQADGRIREYQQKAEALYASLKKMGQKISSERSSKAPALAAELQDRTRELGMPSAQVALEVEPLTNPHSKGFDQVSLLFSANKGVPFQALHKVASGGELSRVMLAFKVLLAHYGELPTQVFDEIDQGVSGEVARKMAGMMQEMSEKHQVVAITHLPQIASRGSRHYKVFKEETGHKTSTGIKALGREERVLEIAQMLSGAQPGEHAMNNARELLSL